MRLEDQSAVLEWFPVEMQTVRRYEPREIKRQRMNFESVAATIEYATNTLPEGFCETATITTGDGRIFHWADIKAMSSDEKRTAVLHAIAAWRKARDAHEPGSPQYQNFQRKMKEAEWELQRLGPSQDSPGIVIKVVSTGQAE
jgi:hypothetical protein